MRILHVLEPADGGVAKHVRDVAAGQIRRGHDVQAVVSDRGRLADDLRALGVGVVALPLRPEMISPRADLRFALVMARLLRGRRWDIVHTHGNKAGAIARPLAALRGLAVVHTAHSFAYATQRYRPRRGQRLRAGLTLGIERFWSPATRVIVCVSEDEAADARRDRIAPAERLMVVRNGVAPLDPAAPDPHRGAARDGQPMVGFVGRFSPEKGPLLLLDALVRLREAGVPFRAALVGDGPLTGAIQERVTSARLGEQVVVRPFPGAVAPTLAAIDVYVLPSLWESMPIGVLEAMAAGLPVVAADAGGVREAVADGETGLLHRRGDVDGLSSALGRLLLDPELRYRMGAAGRARQAAMFSLEAMLDGIEHAYERALGI